MKNLFLTAVTFGTLILTSCGGDKEKSNETIGDSTAVVKDTTPVTVSDTTKFKFDFAIANIPSPANSLNELMHYGVTYDAALLNDSKKASTYTEEQKKALNLGVYNIDMAFAMINEKGEDVLKYMKNVMTLSEGLGLKNAVDGMVGKRAEGNISNKDSLFKILDEIFTKSDSYLRTNERIYTAASVFAGSWLEGLYLTCKVGQAPHDNVMSAKIYNHLWEQRFHLGNLINLLNDYKDKKECAELIADLKPIHDEIIAIKDPRDIDDVRFNSISSKIIAVREKVTK